MGLGVVGPPNGPRLNVRFKPAASISATPVTPDFCTRTGAEAGADIGKGKSITAERSRHTAPTLLQSDDTPRPRQATYWEVRLVCVAVFTAIRRLSTAVYKLLVAM
jgi:hypothetical protein